jgi:hypothetical protein
VFPLDANLPVATEALAKEGWQMLVGVVPVVIYQVFRPKQPEIGEMQLRLAIDDSKVGILRNGKIVE